VSVPPHEQDTRAEDDRLDPSLPILYGLWTGPALPHIARHHCIAKQTHKPIDGEEYEKTDEDVIEWSHLLGP
jgi:hypothetical protein